MKALLVYSGGMDSSVLLYKYRSEIEAAVSFSYGARQDKEELDCAKWNCDKLGIRHIVIPLDFIGKYFHSSILEGGESVPHGHYADDNMRSTVVPFRNGIMLSVAIGLAESMGLDSVMLANHSGDHTIYPDCRPEFIESMDNAARNGTFAGIRVISPFCNMNKREIALEGKTLGVPFEHTYSCYEGRPKHCGVCGTCVERKEALEGFDPTDYEQ